MKWIPNTVGSSNNPIMHSIVGIIDDPILLELAMHMHTRASSKLALQSLASLFILLAVILLRFICLFTANWYSNQSNFEFER